MTLYGIGNVYEDEEGFLRCDGVSPETTKLFYTRERRNEEARKRAEKYNIKWDGEEDYDRTYEAPQSIETDKLGNKYFYDYVGFYLFEITVEE